jgi:thiol-disulfide isomerase/thioredoxin
VTVTRTTAVRLAAMGALILLCGAGPGQPGRPEGDRSAGDPFAAFGMEDVHGRRIDLADFRGKVRVFDIWASWCGPCRQIIPELNDLHARHRDRGMVVIGMSVDEHAAGVVAFQRKIPLRYPNGMFNEAAAALFGYPKVVPTTYLVDREGRIRKRFVGYVDMATLERAVLDLL